MKESLLLLILIALVILILETRKLSRALTCEAPICDMDQIVYDNEVGSTVSYTPKAKTQVYSPSVDPISEFTGARDDWHGEENE